MDYDAFVIGTGVAGSSVAYKLMNSGMKVAVADKGRYGGTCALHGCVPKKILTGAADIVDACNRMVGSGTESHQRLEWPSIIELKDEIVNSLTDPKEKTFREAGIDTYHGKVSFHGSNTLAVDGKLISAKYIIATVGSRPRTIDIPGADHLTTSDEFLDLKALPEKIIFAGGGYISFEFAHIAARAGADVTIIHRGENVLNNFDPDLTNILTDASEKAGIGIHTEQELLRIEKNRDSLTITAFDRKSNSDVIYECDMIVHGMGRVAAIDDLEPEKGKLDIEEGSIAVNEYLQSVSNPAVYAAGDCILPGPALTPTASLQANVVVSNILEGNKYTADYTGIASAVFTIPTLAAVGIAEKEATERHTVIFNDMSGFYSSRRTNLKHAASKVIIEKDTGKVVGAHLIGPDAEDTINLFALAIGAGLTAEQVKKAMYAYPASSYDVRYMLK